MRKILESCPTCGGEMLVSELSCTVCDTTVRSRYAPCPFCRLSPEDLAFMLLFVRSRGNVKDMERELGISYWTIRGRLNEIIAAMGLGGEDQPAEEPPAPPEAAAPPPPAARKAGQGAAAARQAVLDRLNRGELTPSQAAEQLAGLGIRD